MRQRTRLPSIVASLLAATLLASCGGDDEGYPPFEMTYTLVVMDGDTQTWQLDYRSSDDWAKTLIDSSRRGGGMPVGRTALWDGERIAWADSPDGRFVVDGSPEPIETHAFPEFWFSPGYDLEGLPNDFWEEVEPTAEGTRRFRNESRSQGVAAMSPQDEVHIIQTLTLDEQTGIPVEYENTGMETLGIRFRAVYLDLR